MPILRAEPDIQPASLFTDPSKLVKGKKKWSLLQTLTRCEKAVMRILDSKGCDFFGPVIKHSSKTPRGRAMTSYKPLFDGYVFLWGDDDDFYIAQRAKGLQTIHSVQDQENLTRELRQIWRIQQENLEVTPVEKLEEGRLARIETGPLAGIEGTILRYQGGTRLLVAVNSVGRGASIEIDEKNVKPV